MLCIVSNALSYVLSTGVSSNTIRTPSPWSKIPEETKKLLLQTRPAGFIVALSVFNF